MTISKETVEEMKLATKADEPTEKTRWSKPVSHTWAYWHRMPVGTREYTTMHKTHQSNEINKLYTTLRIQYETIEHKGKEYKVADILDGLVALAKNANKGLNND